jgi:hypothetical protein
LLLLSFGYSLYSNPAHWHSNSVQDAALFVIMNIAATPSSLEALRRMGGIWFLSRIRAFGKKELAEISVDEAKQLDLQCLKAVSTLYILYCLYAFKNNTSTSFFLGAFIAVHGSCVSDCF